MTDTSVIKMISGRMTDISVMGEWQVAGVGGTRPLQNVVGEALKGWFSFEARKYLLSFPSYVHFEEFFVSHSFVRFGGQTFERWGVWFRAFSWSLFWNFARSPGMFLRTPTATLSIFFENHLSFFKAEPTLLAWQLWWVPGWANHFGDGTLKDRLKISFSGVGEIERRRTIDRRRDWYESFAVTHGPILKKKKTTKHQSIALFAIWRQKDWCFSAIFGFSDNFRLLCKISSKYPHNSF